MKKYQKTSARLFVKFVRKADNKIILTLPTDSMEVHQYFSNEFINQVISQSFKNIETIGSVLIVVDQEFVLK